ncbi:hypothetical protein E2P71_01580 [Candidatus Bathyarchaeota archaeon]|nr:hypothetical protein E2P71_01580 [Candidatus Bathyarchaeota archaeon]
MIHEVSLNGENAPKSQVVKEAVDRLVSIGGIVYSVVVYPGKLLICFTHDPLTALKSLHELVAHYGLRSISLKENLRKVTVDGKQLDSIRSLLPELLLNPRVHRFNSCSLQLILMVEASALHEICESLTDTINHALGGH